jgi:hypothetical protein
MDELENLRPMLDRRYEEVRSGKVKPISGDEVEAYFRQKFEDARAKSTVDLRDGRD